MSSFMTPVPSVKVQRSFIQSQRKFALELQANAANAKWPTRYVRKSSCVSEQRRGVPSEGR